MRVLVACEFTGIVRDAFIERGHDAVSCDIIPTEKTGPHYQGDVRNILSQEWDMMIAHPPCTLLTVAGARWWKGQEVKQRHALDFVRTLLGAPIPLICLENPVGLISTQIRKPDQIVQPWEFGHGEVKKTCLWLKGLPRLTATDIVPEGTDTIRIDGLPPIVKPWKSGRVPRVHYLGSSGSQDRSRTYSGIAAAMADQWG